VNVRVSIKVSGGLLGAKTAVEIGAQGAGMRMESNRLQTVFVPFKNKIGSLGIGIPDYAA